MSPVIESTRPRTLSRTPVRLHGSACVQVVPEPAGAAYNSVAGAATAGTGRPRATAAAKAPTATFLAAGHERVRINAPQSERGAPHRRTVEAGVRPQPRQAAIDEMVCLHAATN